jgi:hypothetical protein
MEPLPLALGLSILLAAFVFEFFDSALGMGYGTSLTPVMLALGFSPADIVPAILLSELVTGVIASIFHHRHGNASFLPDISGLYMPDALKKIHTRDGLSKAWQRSPQDLKVALVLALSSAIGALIAAVLALSLPAVYVKLYIGLMVASIGVVILLRRNHAHAFSWKRILALGGIAAFNKGMSGGGYGPVVTSGQLLSGVKTKSAVAITSFSEIVASASGLLTFFILGKDIFSPALPYLLLGAALSAPLSALVVSRTNVRHVTVFVGVLTLSLGCYTLVSLL